MSEKKLSRKTESQFLNLAYDTLVSKRADFNITYNQPVSRIDFSFGNILLADYSDQLILTSDLNPHPPNIVGATSYYDYSGELGSSSCSIIFDKPVSVQGSHWLEINTIQADANQPSGASLKTPINRFQSYVLVNLTFYFDS